MRLFTCIAKPQSMYFCCMCFLTTRRRCTPAVARAAARRTGAAATGAAAIVVVGIVVVVVVIASSGAVGAGTNGTEIANRVLSAKYCFAWEDARNPFAVRLEFLYSGTV